MKEICAALLESDVNVKLVAGLRQSVKSTVKASFEAGADKGKESNRRNVAQKVAYNQNSGISRLVWNVLKMIMTAGDL